jgi:2-dehydropantoate 2-reductase
MKCAILGAGAIGTLVAAQLSRIDEVELLLCSRREQALALAAIGLRLETESMPTSIPSSRWTVVEFGETLPSDWAAATDVVILCSKTNASEELSAVAARLLSSEGFTISLQNGISNENILAGYCGSNRTLGALTTHGATRLEPGVTRWAGRGEIVIGNCGGNLTAESPLVAELLTHLEAVELNPRWSENIVVELWLKLLLNCAINPLAAICGCNNGELLESAELHEQSVATMLEAAKVGRMVGIDLPGDESLIEQLNIVLASTAENDCSMLQDIRRGAITEIDSINGEVLKIAEHAGLACPLNSQLVALVKGIENSLRH